MTPRILTLIGGAVLLAAAIAFFALGGESIALGLAGLGAGALGGGAFMGGGVWPPVAKTPPPQAGPKGYTRLLPLGALAPLAAVGLWLMLSLGLGGCGTTITADRSRALVDPYGPRGVSMVCEVGGEPKFTCRGRQSTLSVHADIAKRICAKFPKRCTWTVMPPEVTP